MYTCWRKIKGGERGSRGRRDISQDRGKIYTPASHNEGKSKSNLCIFDPLAVGKQCHFADQNNSSRSFSWRLLVNECDGLQSSQLVSKYTMCALIKRPLHVQTNPLSPHSDCLSLILSDSAVVSTQLQIKKKTRHAMSHEV